MNSEGGCLCGAVRYRVSGEPLYSTICHCASCRKAAAAPTVAWLTFERDHFAILSGTPRSFASSPGVQRTFCTSCGTPLTYASERRPTHIDITTASLDDPTRFPPTYEVWLEDRLAWQPIDASRKHFDGGGD